MASGGSRADSGRRHRSYLLLTTSFLIWNIWATALERTHGVASAPPFLAVRPDAALSRSVEMEQSRTPEFARRGPPSVLQKYLLEKRLDINVASADEISELPGVSRGVAAAVLAERERVGRFRTVEDLLRVKGIKAKRLKKILPFLAPMENN